MDDDHLAYILHIKGLLKMSICNGSQTVVCESLLEYTNCFREFAAKS